MRLLKSLFIITCFNIYFAQENLEISYEDYFTPQEVLEHFEADEETKKSVFFVTHPYIAPDWLWALRTYINHNFSNDRSAKGAKRVSFKEPLLIHSVVRLDESLLAKAMPIIEANSHMEAKKDLARFNVSMRHIEQGNYSTEDYNFKKNQAMEQYNQGDIDMLYEKNLKSGIYSVQRRYSDYYLLPTFYQNAMEGYILVRPAIENNMGKSFSGFKRYLSYPLKVSFLEAQKIANTQEVALLTDLSNIKDLGTKETIFWLFDTRAIGAMTGALYRIVNEQNNEVNPFTISAQMDEYRSMLGTAKRFDFTVPVRLELLQNGLYNWDATLNAFNMQRNIWLDSLPRLMAYLVFFIMLITIAITIRKEKSP